MSGPATGYLTSCPNCGGQLAPHVGQPQSAPWLCSNCSRGWWVAELTGEARAAWDGGRRDFGFPGRVAIGLAVKAEHAAAHERGDSVHPSMRGLPGVAAALAAWRASRGLG